jgi:hypothetical protein
VIHRSKENGYIKIGQGSDTILYGRGDGFDTIEDTSGVKAERDALALTNLAPGEIELSRAGETLLVVKATGEVVSDTTFFRNSGTAAAWTDSGFGIDSLRLADGTTWGRATTQQQALAGGRRIYSAPSRSLSPTGICQKATFAHQG